MARELQSALLPRRFPNFPHQATEEDSAVRFYPFFRPSTIVSGDFFDVFDIADDKAGLFICDVMGPACGLLWSRRSCTQWSPSFARFGQGREIFWSQQIAHSWGPLRVAI